MPSPQPSTLDRHARPRRRDATHGPDDPPPPAHHPRAPHTHRTTMDASPARPLALATQLHRSTHPHPDASPRLGAPSTTAHTRPAPSAHFACALQPTQSPTPVVNGPHTPERTPAGHPRHPTRPRQRITRSQKPIGGSRLKTLTSRAPPSDRAVEGAAPSRDLSHRPRAAGLPRHCPCLGCRCSVPCVSPVCTSLSGEAWRGALPHLRKPCFTSRKSRNSRMLFAHACVTPRTERAIGVKSG